MKLTVLCLNCFGIPISFNKRLRFKLIAKEINKLQPDIVMLQEVIEHNDKNLFSEELEKFGWHFYSEKNGLLESGGLVTISKNLKLKNLKFHKFIEQGPKKLITVPDKVLGKGFQSMGCNLGDKDFLIINAHLLCTYAQTKEDLEFQQKQFEQLTKFVKAQSINNIILVGDLNSYPDSSDMLALEKHLSLSDSLNLKEYTIDPKNLNRGWLMNWFSDGKPYRTDYVLTSKGVAVQKSSVMFKEPVEYGKRKIHLSDHFAVFAELQV